ncbi:VOC family protein [Phormidium tenue FACHB-886]|nr:VOC family protein [Phormidium tenue FACHB-886]
MTQTIPRFHLAFPVTNLEETRSFYCNQLGCTVGRTSDRWIDFDFYGHQITAHLQSDLGSVSTNPVDGEAVPVRHFGVILDWQTWHQLADRLKSEQMDFVIQPYIRFQGEVGEQATLFIQDPSGNALEFKSFKDDSRIFAT